MFFAEVGLLAGGGGLQSGGGRSRDHQSGRDGQAYDTHHRFIAPASAPVKARQQISGVIPASLGPDRGTSGAAQTSNAVDGAPADFHTLV